MADIPEQSRGHSRGTLLERTHVVGQLKQIVPLVKPGPRYTSYPPATEFSTEFDVPAATAELQRLASEQPDAPVSIYVHVPYCPSLCWYCGCNVLISRDHAKGAAYVDLLHQELQTLANTAGRRPLAELALGGGSPNFLAPPELKRLVGTITSLFEVAPGAELSIEFDPRETDDDQVSAVAECGFTRVSVGVQDFDPAVGAAINRTQTIEQTAHLVEFTRAQGIRSVNVDLVYGLPLQTPATFERTLVAIEQMRPDRIALFGYAHLPHLRPHQKLVERAGPLPDTEQRADLVDMAMERLSNAGYVRIGLDHFALPTDELVDAAIGGRLHRNFQGYTVHRSDILLASGTTGITDSGGAYWQNLPDIDQWANHVRAGKLPVARGVALDADDQLRRHVIMRLMCDGVLPMHAVDAHYGIEFESYFERELTELSSGEYLQLLTIHSEQRELEATELGRHLIRNICMVFDRYLAKRMSGKQPRFSPTL